MSEAVCYPYIEFTGELLAGKGQRRYAIDSDEPIHLASLGSGLGSI